MIRTENLKWNIPTGFFTWKLGVGPTLVTEFTEGGGGAYLGTADGERRWLCGHPEVRALVFGPVPATWCDECGHDTAEPHPYAVYIKAAGATREYVTRNHSHESAHQIAERERAEGARVSISIDTCG